MPCKQGNARTLGSTVCLERYDRGSVTAEFAVLLPAIAILIGLIIALGAASARRVTCQDAANKAAWVLTQDDDSQAARQAITRSVGTASTTFRELSDGSISISVICPIGQGPLQLLPFSVEGHALALPSQ